MTLRVYSPLVFKKKKITHFLLMMPRGVTRCKKALFHELSQLAERELRYLEGKKKKKGFKIVAQNGAVAPGGRSNLALWH